METITWFLIKGYSLAKRYPHSKIHELVLILCYVFFNLAEESYQEDQLKNISTVAVHGTTDDHGKYRGAHWYRPSAVILNYNRYKSFQCSYSSKVMLLRFLHWPARQVFSCSSYPEVLPYFQRGSSKCGSVSIFAHWDYTSP